MGCRSNARPGALTALVCAQVWLLSAGLLLLAESDPAVKSLLDSGDELTVVAVGDILLSRHIGKKIDLAEDPRVPFQNVEALLSQADIAFGNLESPIAVGKNPIRRGVVFRCLTRYVPGLVFAGFDVLSTANNHAFDQGSDNLEFTLDYLDSQDIMAVGTRKRDDAEGFARVLRRKNTRLGFLAYSYAAYNDGGARLSPQVATWHDLDRVIREVKELKESSDLVFVSIHAGREYIRQPERKKVEFAHAVIDAGADVVLGHHPHWIQPVEIYRDRPIFYSLGNFVFDQGKSIETSQGLMVEMRIREKRLVSARLVPVVIEDFCCPTVADNETKMEILGKIGLYTDLMRFHEPELASGK